jgi:hypothetical protein
MSLLLAASRIYLPRTLQQNRLNELFMATADAFQRQLPQLKGYSPDQILTEYALFTAGNAEETIKQGNMHGVKTRLYVNARQIGQKIRRELNIHTLQEVMQACGVIYKALKIEFCGDLQGQILIKSCFFSSFYSGDVCRIISSLDAGLVAGLSGGSGMEFSQRITEGNTYCKAILRWVGSPG